MINLKQQLDMIDIPLQITNNYSSLYRLAGDLIDCERGQYEDVSWVNNKGAWPNRIYGINLSKENIDHKLEWLVDGMKSGRMPKIIGTSQFTKPENYEMYFEAHGLVKTSDAEGMGLSTKNLNTDFKPKTQVVIKKVSNQAELKDFAKIVTPNLFQMDMSYVKPYYECISRLRETGAADFFIAYDKGTPVSTAMVYYSEEVAGLYHIATDIPYRGLGIGKQITIGAILHAEKKGYDNVVLFASEDGKHMYQQLGFESVCKLGRYKLKQ
ncbi:MAG: GNAT family N-acetyltransferase [Vallitaleaceae bacterium]|jgi:GNAT superfamily N-acetyltransferase|nr:GNAT family N-acetyltransferase [Vallitaleaceae bacterium]